MDYWRVWALVLIIPMTSVDVCSSSSTTQSSDIGEDASLFQQSGTDHPIHRHMYDRNYQREQAQDTNAGDCQVGDGASYRGTVAVAWTGKTCQRWDSQTPHRHDRTPAKYPSSGLEQNYCRNPDGEKGVWCYTTDPGKRWGSCDVPICATVSNKELFTKEDGHFFGDGPDHIEAYNDIDADECARRCLQGHGSYDGVSRPCLSFNHRPAGSPEGGSARCWLRSSAKDLAASPGPEWDRWPHRNYYQRQRKGPTDNFCERDEDEVETEPISSSAKLRLNFAGRFLADVSTYNNYRSNFDINRFDPLKSTGWHSKGSNDFRLVNCTVTQVCLANGRCVEYDPIVGQPIKGSNSTTAGKLVDLDPDNQVQSMIWGLVVGVDGFLKGDFKPRSFHHMHDACEGLNCRTVSSMTRFSAVFLSTLQNVEWTNGPLSRRSSFIQQVRSLRCEHGFQLHVKLNVRNMIVDPKSPDFPYGRVVGTIYAVVSKNLPYGPYKRMLWAKEGIEGRGHVPFYVDSLPKNIVLDFANSMKFDIKGNVVESSRGPLYLIQYNGTTRGCELLGNEAYNLGEIKLGGDDWFQRTAGMTYLSVTDQIKTIKYTSLAVVQQISQAHCEIVLEERQDGLFVEAVDNRIMRQEPDKDWNMRFRTFQYGRSVDQMFIKPKQDFPEIGIMSSKPSGNDGISTIIFRSRDPGQPRKEQQLDGQVYTYDIIAKKDGGTEFEVKDLRISVHLYSKYTFIPGNVTWYEHVYPIFQQYANLYPTMKPIINLASYEDVTGKLKLLKHALTLKETHSNYMPVSRDLSPQKREMILSWLDNPLLGTITYTLDDLKRSLQMALQLELSTIPPYLSALFSIKDGYNREVAALIKSVVVDEMKHMALVSNLLNAIGGAPNLNNRSVTPSYPSPLPGGTNPGLVVRLERCSLNHIRTVFQGIERPDCNTTDSGVVRYLRTERKRIIMNRIDESSEIARNIFELCEKPTTRPQTIGAIYIYKILCPMAKLERYAQEKDPKETIFIKGTKQITEDQWLGNELSSSPYKVSDLGSALKAIVDITTEGEGSDPCDPFDKEGELSHYFKFAEVLHGRRLRETNTDDTSSEQRFDNFFPCDEDMKCTKTFSFVGRLVPFFEDGVWPTISNPNTKSYPPESQARKYSDNFNKIYTGLLKCIHEAFNGNPDKMKNDCMGMMSSLTAWGKRLVQTPIDPDGDPEIGPNAAPIFEFQDE